MDDRVERKRLMIMKILREAGLPLSSQKIQEQLVYMGMDVSERTVRFHLKALDSLGFTGYKGRKGRFLTTQGLRELERAHVYSRVGFLSSKIDDMMCRMSFDPATSRGSVLINMSLIEKRDRDAVAALVPPVFSAGLAHGALLALMDEGESIGDIQVPRGKMGLGTVCSITFNGALMQAGIPVLSIFGGLLEIHNRIPNRFTAIIRYDGTSLDPLEIYIASRMTSSGAAARVGYGLIGASFREIPAAAREKVVETDVILKNQGLGGFLELGYPGQSLLDIPVGEGRVGLIITGGLNALAPLLEEGIAIESKALFGFMDYSLLFSFEELSKRLSQLT